MTTDTKFVAMNQAEFFKAWLENAWPHTPSQVIAVPMNGIVLFGALSQDKKDRVSFGLEAEDARIIGEKLLKAAQEAGK
ncbi:hypothetical protein AB9K41_15255 [Cribrihabitans sp. XS_ASV171]